MSTFTALLTLATPQGPGQYLGDIAAGCVLISGAWHGCLKPVLSSLVHRPGHSREMP